MFAVVNIAGQQFKVSENSTYYVPKLSKEPNKNITFKEVLVLNDDKNIKTKINVFVTRFIDIKLYTTQSSVLFIMCFKL